LFVLAFCIFRKEDYSKHLVPAVHDLKFRWFGHDAVILHEHEIRRADAPFVFLGDPVKKRFFMDHLTKIMQDAPMTVVASVIKKEALAKRYAKPHNPYELALLFCMERAREFLDEVVQAPGGTTHIVCEARGGSGGKEDRELELEFRRISDGANRLSPKPVRGFDIVFVDKKSNAAGLQIADLIARPIGLAALRPEQPNRAYDVIAPKVWDKKVFP
jgi:hypothetical protein